MILLTTLFVIQLAMLFKKCRSLYDITSLVHSSKICFIFCFMCVVFKVQACNATVQFLFNLLNFPFKFFIINYYLFIYF